MVDFIWFTYEKLFTIAPVVNSQNDSLYAHVGERKKDVNEDQLLCTRSNLSKSVMVLLGVSLLGCTSLHFLELGSKINDEIFIVNFFADGNRQRKIIVLKFI